ncbi:hypothetical protein Tco_0018595 [Tanacetum coccineum]
MSCLPDHIMVSVISCETTKATWTNLVHSFKGLLDTKENRIMDLKLKYQTFRAKPTESLSQTYTRYKTLLDELANDGVNLSKHEINFGFINSLLEIGLTFSLGLRNANHTQNLDLADIYGRFDFQENSDDEVDERSIEYLRDLDIDPSMPQTPKTFQPKNKGLVTETFDWDEEEVLDDEEVTQVKVLMDLADNELTVGKNHARNGESIDITIRKNKVLGGEMLTESSKMNENENLFVLASMVYDHEMVPKTKDWVERLNPNSRLLNFNTRRILVPESQAINESLKPIKTSNTYKSSKDSEMESLTHLPPLKNIQGASPSSEVMPLTFQPYSLKERPGLRIVKHTKPETQDSLNKSVLGTVTVRETKPTIPSVSTEVKDTEQESKINELTKLV